MARKAAKPDLEGGIPEFFIDLDGDGALGNGLSPDARLPRHSKYAETLTNLRAIKGIGAVTESIPAYPLTDGIPTFESGTGIPRFFRGERDVFLFDKTTPYSVDTTASPWTRTALTPYSSNTLGSEALTNGDMSSATGWTVGSGWSIFGGVAIAAPASTTLSQAVVAIGTVYRVEYTIGATSAGRVRAKCGTGAGTWQSTAGTYVEYITCAGNTTFALEGDAFAGTVDNATVKPIPALSVTGLYPWQFVSFLGLNIATNGATVILDIDGNPGSLLMGTTDPDCLAVGKHGSRLFMGGLSGTWFAGSRWTSILEKWRHVNDGDRVSYTAQALDAGWVAYCEMGGGASDRPYIPFLAMLGFYGDETFDSLKGVIETAIENREIGLEPLRHPSSVWAFHEFRGSVIAFGTSGVSRLLPLSGLYDETPIHPIGIAGPAAVGGSWRECVFLDTKGELWRIKPESAPEFISRNTLLAGLTAANVTINYDASQQTYAISDGVIGFTLDEDGVLSGVSTIAITSYLQDPSEGLCATYYDSDQRVANGGFGSSASWTLATGWTISGGLLVGTGVLPTGSTGNCALQSLTLTAGREYTLSFRLVRTAGTLAVWSHNLSIAPTTYTTSGLKTITFTPSTFTSPYTTGVLCFGASGTIGVTDFTGTIDNVSILPTERDVLFRSMPMDINERGSKMPTTFQIAREGITELTAGIDYRNIDSASYATGPRTQATAAGAVNPWPRRGFVDAKLVVAARIPRTSSGRLERIEFRYQAEDKTHLRGTKGVPQKG